MIAIIGAGAWGTTMAKVVADAGSDVVVWGRDPAVVREINEKHTNEAYAPGLALPERVTASDDLPATLRESSTLIVALPSQVVRETLAGVADQVREDSVVVSLMKGIELGTDKRMGEVLTEVLGLPPERFVVLSGPNLSREIAAGQPAASVLACTDIERARSVARLVATSYFRPYVTDDVIGVELAGAVKNVIALAVGMAAGKGYGDNTTATLITRGLAEITRLALALGGERETMAGLAGMGDLVATCASRLSRNHRLGRHIGEGMGFEEALVATGGTAEGAKSCRSVAHLAESLGVDMPITRAVVAVLYGGISVDEMTRMLLSRPRKDERD
ncbi:MAG TPA: NAD(P)H-dependent glycerol-3-phosphate dehydrogenase [Actinomycetaceae bacterium]|nr:NAD(P)H-dependent glycerol-3-phosphate dehydrogenase [Actinomycetaceae bacterium]